MIHRRAFHELLRHIIASYTLRHGISQMTGSPYGACAVRHHQCGSIKDMEELLIMRRPHDHLCIRRRNEHAGPLIHIVFHLSYSFIHGDGIYCYSQDLYLIGHTVPSSNFINTHIELVYYKKKGASMYDAPPTQYRKKPYWFSGLFSFFLTAVRMDSSRSCLSSTGDGAFDITSRAL